MTKAAWRKLYLEKRLALSVTEYDALSRQLCETFFTSTDLSAVRILHTFLPIRKNKEPDTLLIVNRITSEFPSIRLSVPRVNHQTGILEHFFWEGVDQVTENKWGIPEPVGGTITPAVTIDMVLVPMLVFDLHGHRVGYGKGYYDRFLSICRKDCRKVGLSFFPPVDKIATGDHDQKLDQVVTPDKSYQC